SVCFYSLGIHRDLHSFPTRRSSDLIVGDYTARIGDPSGASAERPIIPPEEIDRMAERFFESAYTILDPDRTEVRFNGEWLSKVRSEEHTSELQSRGHLVCRLLLEKK